LAVASRDGKQYGVKTGNASINKTIYLLAKKDKYTDVQITMSLK